MPLFPADNNGSIIVLPAVAAAGAATVSGSLIFGIDTESNNASGSVTVLALDGNGDFLTTLGTQSLSESFLDSGSNGLFFYDPDYQNLLCGTDFVNFYCPGSPQTLTATLPGTLAQTTISDSSRRHPMSPEKPRRYWLSDQGLSS